MTTNDINRLADTAASCPCLRRKYDVDIREFVVLAALQSTGVANIQSLAALTGLSMTSVESCLLSLLENGLLRFDPEIPNQYASSSDGRALIRKAQIQRST